MNVFSKFQLTEFVGSILVFSFSFVLIVTRFGGCLFEVVFDLIQNSFGWLRPDKGF